MKRSIFILWLALAGVLLAEVKVATLHPLLEGVVERLGGERVELVAVGKEGTDLHRFSPSPQELIALGRCDLVLASGKEFERYLSDLKESLGATTVVEVGESLPSLMMDEACEHCEEGHGKEHHHDHEVVDPHWWHDVKNMERAVRVIERALAKADPAGRDEFAKRSQELRGELRELDGWVKEQVALIPEAQRKLVTAHAAFGYFCNAYGFESVHVLGVSGDHEVPARELAADIKVLKDQGIRAVFPERTMNPKVLSEIAREAGARVGKPLVADGAVKDYSAMVRENVGSIVAALASDPAAEPTKE